MTPNLWELLLELYSVSLIVGLGFYAVYTIASIVKEDQK